MTGFIIVAIVIIAIIYFVNQSNEEKRKIEEEKKRLALIQQKKLEEKKKLDEVKRLEKIRLQKIEDEKYETFTIVVVGQNNNKYTCVLQRQNKTFAYVTRPDTAFQLNETLKLLKEKANDFDWISEVQHNKKQKEVSEQNAKKEGIARHSALQLIENQQRIFCESNTSYCANIHSRYILNPRSFNFSTVRSLSQDCGVWNQLNNGVDILTTYQQLSQYIYSYGKMHQEKLLQSLQVLPNLQTLIKNQDLQIIDYGCGQGIGSIVLVDYLKSIQATNFTISKIKLIEPSELALKRASLNVRYSLKSINQDENVLSIHKSLDNLTNSDISTNSQSIKFHIFSNIIDVENISVQSICNKITETQNGINYFICVSPKFWEDGVHPRNLKLDSFMSHFQQRHNVSVISTRETNINNWKRYERVFKATM